MRRILPFLLLPLLCILIPASSSAALRDCGSVSFKRDVSGGQVSAKGIDCKAARKRAVACGRDGNAPKGWRVSRPGGRYGGEFKMKRGQQVVKVALAGGTPPKLSRCVKRH